MKKYFFLVAAFFCSNILLAQNNHFGLAIKHNGICFGNSKVWNGLRINFWDKHVRIVDGINLAVCSRSKISNGISLGILYSEDTICNGIKIGGLVAASDKINGLIVSAIAIGSRKFNGMGVSMMIFADTLNGFFIAPWFVASRSLKSVFNGFSIGGGVGIERFNGVCFSFFNNEINVLNGFSVGYLNKARQLHGVQIGLWNVALNKKHFKRLPIINFCFRKTNS